MRPVRPRSLAALLAFVLSTAAFANGATAIGNDDTVELNLPAGPLLGCLEHLTSRTGIPIVDSTGKVADLECRGGRSIATIGATLDALLKPFGLSWQRRADGAIEVIAGQSTGHIQLGELSVVDTPLPALEPATATAPPVTPLAQDSMSVTRITQERLETAPLLSLSQINRYAPNVYASGPGLAIRAVERDLDALSGLSIHLDDIDLGTSLIEGDMVSVDNLSALDLERGPRSFERGGPAAAGALNLYTAAPAETPTLRAGIGMGNEGSSRMSASWSGRFGDGESGLRVAIENRRMPNYVKEQNVLEANKPHRTVDNLYTKLNLVPESIPGLSAEVALLTVVGDDTPLWTSSSLNGEVLPLPQDLKSYARIARVLRTKAFGASTNVQYGNDEWNARFTANSTVAQHYGHWLGSTLGPSDIFNTERRRAAGLSLHHHTDDWDFALGGETSGTSFADQDAKWDDNELEVVNDYRKDLDLRTRSIWAWIEHRWGDTFAVGGGVRSVKEYSRQDTVLFKCASGDLREPGPGFCADRWDPDDPPFRAFGEVRTSTPVPLVVGQWTPSTKQRVTLSHGRGIRSSVGITPELIQPAERDDSTQLALQSTWLDGALTTRTALFRTRVRERFHFDVNHIGARGLAQGAELEFDWKIAPRWRLNGGAGWIDARFQYYRYGNDDPLPRMPGAPERTVLLGLRYGESLGWYGTIDAYRAAEAESAQAIEQRFRRPGYSLVDLRVGYRRDEWDLAFLVTNALDERYLDRVDFALSSRLPDIRYRIGDPRRTELRWQYEWQ